MAGQVDQVKRDTDIVTFDHTLGDGGDGGFGREE